MKKLLIVLLALGALTLLAAGCTQSAESAPAPVDKTASDK